MKDEQKKLITEIMNDDAKDRLYKQQTAVEWLAEQLKRQGFLYDLDIEAAKQMEKEQIIDAYYYDSNSDLIKDDGEQYYNETYGQ